ncbi:MAG: class A beta-lactamase [Gemmatimonadota bacterium]|nr:class A beta-lactamase [Gemmatimonadota bacterium]
MTMQRREALLAMLYGITMPLLRVAPRAHHAGEAPDFAEVERKLGGRLGVAVLDVSTGRRLAYRADERFPMCSTFKWLLAAKVLSLVDAGREQLSRVVPYSQADLLEYAPITRARVAEGGMQVSELIAAAIQYSDNTAANLLLRAVGGPAAVTSYLRGVGDSATRLDRMEPDLNSAVPVDVRDTTTPNSMVADMHSLLVGRKLGKTSRELLLGWLEGNTTGNEKLRAGIPRHWRIGDKTGSGAHGSMNDVAIMWPSAQRAVLVAAYITETAASLGDRNEVLAGVGRAVATWVARDRR